MSLNESIVDEAAREWFGELGNAIGHGLHLAPGEAAAERDSFGDTSTSFFAITPTKFPWPFIHAALTQPEVSDHRGQMADRGAYPAVRPEISGAMQIALPNERTIPEALHRTCSPLFERAEANSTQSRTLAALRDTLLPKLLSGELSVSDATRKGSAV